MKKDETLEEFLARGGKIKKIPYKSPEVKQPITKQTTSTPINFLSYDEADLLYGKPSKTKKKKTSGSSVDLSALPEELKAKFISKLSQEIEEMDDE